MLLAWVVALVCGILAIFFANDSHVGVQVRKEGLQVAGGCGIVIVLAFGLGALIGIRMLRPAYHGQGWAVNGCRPKVEDLAGHMEPGERCGAKLA
jgi:hypothetical protein